MGMQLNFNAAQVEPNQAFDPLPAGWYNFMITSSEEKPTSAGDGSYLLIELVVIDGPFKGRKCFDRFNLKNKNAMAVEIAYKQLSAICHATGVMQINDSTMLHNRPLQGKVAVRPAGAGQDGKFYDAANEVKAYKAFENGAPVGATNITPPPPPPAIPQQGVHPGVTVTAAQFPQTPAPVAQAPVMGAAPAMPAWAGQTPVLPQQEIAAAAPAPVAPTPPWQGQAAPTPPWAKQ